MHAVLLRDASVTTEPVHSCSLSHRGVGLGVMCLRAGGDRSVLGLAMLRRARRRRHRPVRWAPQLTTPPVSHPRQPDQGCRRGGATGGVRSALAAPLDAGRRSSSARPVTERQLRPKIVSCYQHGKVGSTADWLGGASRRAARQTGSEPAAAAGGLTSPDLRLRSTTTHHKVQEPDRAAYSGPGSVIGHQRTGVYANQTIDCRSTMASGPRTSVSARPRIHPPGRASAPAGDDVSALVGRQPNPEAPPGQWLTCRPHSGPRCTTANNFVRLLHGITRANAANGAVLGRRMSWHAPGVVSEFPA